MWPEFSNINNADVPVKDKVSYFQLIRQSENLIELDANSKRLLADSISKHLDSPFTRCEGLLTWLTSIQSSKLYLSNWGCLLEASLLLSNSSPSKKLALEIFNELILTFKDEAQFVGSFLRFWPLICKCLTDDFENNEVIFLSLRSIKIAMENFPVLVGQSAAEILPYILKNMDCESSVVSEVLSDCFSLFPKMMTEKFTHHSTWQGLFDRGTNTLELQIKDIIMFYTGTNESRNLLKSDDYLRITSSATDGIPLLLHKVRVFISLSKCLTKLMWTYSPDIEVRVENLLEVVKLVIYLTDQIEMSVNPFHLIYFPKMCISSLLLLESIILSFHVVEHTDSILAMMLKILQNEKINEEPIYNREVRLATWKFLGVWIKQYGGSVSSKIVSDKIVGELICDISKESEHTDSEPPTLDTQICLQALKVLGGFIQTAATFIEKKNWEFIINRVLERARHVQLNLYPLKTLNQPYSDEGCRLELYNLLLDCCSYDHPFRENCLRRSVHIFKVALKDPSIEIITLGRRANNLFQNFLNPKKRPPDYTLPVIKEHSSECQENIIADWKVPTSFAGSWQQEQLNGGAEPMEMLQGPPPMYHVEDEAYQQAVVDSENTQERPSDHESPPHYQELQPANQYNSRTYSRGSSRSESMDNSVEEEIVDDEENMHSQLSHKRKASDVPVANSSRPNIQMLKAHARMEECVDNETVVQDVQSDVDSLEEDEVSQPKSFVAENGTVDDSEEDEEAYDEDEAEEEYEEANEDRFSSEPEERPIKRFKKDQEIIMNLEDDVSSEEETNKTSAETEEIVECRDDNEEESKPEVNGGKSASPSQTENDPTVDEMISDLVVAEPDS